MRLHETWTGAANPGDKTYAVGSVEGIAFTAYASGCNIVILSSSFERVQIIPGVCHNNIQISCLDCSVETGKIAAAYDDRVVIFEPTPLRPVELGETDDKNVIPSGNKCGLEYWWVETGQIQTHCCVTTLAWNNDSFRILTAGDVIQLWEYKQNEPKVRFAVGPEKDTSDNRSTSWTCIWKIRPANPIHFLAFSPDGLLFATAAKNDRLVRVWYQNHQFSNKGTSDTLGKTCDVAFSYIYLAHPRSVTGFSWRKTSRFMPRGSVANMLVTSCLDNICRLWSETHLPEDAGIHHNIDDDNPESVTARRSSKHRIQRQKARFVQRFRHMRQSFAARTLARHSDKSEQVLIPILPSTYSVHDQHKQQAFLISPGLHFHLSATISAVGDIPLVPAMTTGSSANSGKNKNFVIHWMNNKEIEFSLQAEKILEDLCRVAMSREDTTQMEMELAKMEGATTATTTASGTPAHRPLEEVSAPSRVGLAGFRSNPQIPGSKDATVHGSTVSLAHSDMSSTAPGTTPGIAGASLAEALDHRVDTIIKEWHHNSDLLFAIHPIDGSLLVWVADFLDEYQPGSFRQAQVSFSSRIPNAIPLGDASTMCSSVSIYNAEMPILRDLFKLAAHEAHVKAEKLKNETVKTETQKDQADGDSESGEDENENEEDKPAHPPRQTNDDQEKQAKTSSIIHKYKPAPVVKMISKHTNGTLNLWSVTFADKSKFATLLNINHKARASGHRFRVNDIVCHPVLPLLLTTSHHNVVRRTDEEGNDDPASYRKDEVFCSELILWRVDPVGPLSKSGGITELARINSQEISAFTDVAWIPTLLPSSTLGPASNSPSACFVASDGHSLRVYQAVIDARTLLAEINSSALPNFRDADVMSVSSDDSGANFRSAAAKINDKLRIVSTQSTARPGAVVELEPIEDAKQDWQKTMLLHAFQEHVIVSQGSFPSNQTDIGLITSKMSAIVDLRQSTGGKFCEPFYVLVVEKTDDHGAMMHVWRLVLASEGEGLSEDNADSSGSVTPVEMEPGHQGQPHHPHHKQVCEVHVSTEKVSSQKLPLPPDVEVIHAVPAVGHLSSSSIFPACFAPYAIVTACSDHTIRFWRTKMSESGPNLFEWQEWKMESADGDSSITVPGIPVSVCAAYTGRLAVAYQAGTTFTRKKTDDQSRYVNLCVAIYECESTGGSEWIREDTIHLKNIELRTATLPPVDLSVYDDHTGVSRLVQHFHEHAKHERMTGLTSVPSLSTLEGVKKYISEMGNTPSAVAPKQTVMLDWVSKEDGTHLLTITVGNKVLLLTAVSSDIAQANMKALSDARTAPSNRPLLRKSSSIGIQAGLDEVRWMQIRRIELKTADGLNPLPMSSAWVRDGLFLIGMDSEFAVYSQWRGREETAISNADTSTSSSGKDFVDHRHLPEAELINMAQESQLRSVRSAACLQSGGGTKPLADIEKRKKVVVSPACENSPNDPLLQPDFGLFEASHLACPVLPQYHPKQLMELLNSGKIRWVKAILAHLVRCISGIGSDRIRFRSGGSFNDDAGNRSPRNWSRSRTLSVSYPNGALSPGGLGLDVTGESKNRASLSGIPEELTLDYTQINSIPPLPLWTLLAADNETLLSGKEDQKAYDDLFHGGMEQEQSLEDLLEDDFDTDMRQRRRMSSGGGISGDKQSFSYFGPRQARLLSTLLTHAHLPGLTSLDQMHLMALADTVASCKMNFCDRFAIDAAKAAMSRDNPATTGGDEPTAESLDDCGLRFLLAMKHFSYLQRCLPLSQRAQLQRQGLATSNLIWAFHSESEEELLSMIPSVSKGTPTWAELRELGVAWWVKNDNTLRKLIEKVAKAAFQEKNDPLDAAVFYLAMKKKSLVWGLFRSVRDERMTSFFSNNFGEDRWRQAALKNAFVLLAKQRFLHAAAFFLLAGSLKDAVEVCIDKLDDLQLAMVFSRLFDGGGQSECYKQLLYDHVLGGDESNNDLSKAHPDPFLRSVGLWTVKDYSGSLATLVQANVGEMHPKFNRYETLALSGVKKMETDPSVFNFYVYLRTHPLITRHALAQNAQKKGAIMLTGFRGAKSIDQDTVGPGCDDAVTPLERRLYFSTAHYHLRAGCPALAVEVLSKLPGKIVENSADSMIKSKAEENVDNCVETGTLDMDWSQLEIPVKSKKVEEKPRNVVDEVGDDFGGLDWSRPLVSETVKDEDELKLEWSDDPDTEEEDLPIGGTKLVKTGSLKKSTIKSNSNIVEDDEDLNTSGRSKSSTTIDVIAQQLKFIACLKIMMEELSTLATGFEVDGGLLRYQLYIWLEREVDALKQLCNYGAGVAREESADQQTFEGLQRKVIEFSLAKGRTPTLHEVMLAEKADFEAKVQQAEKRKRWLKANQTLLRTLLSYCSLRGANGGGLASVRMELILLLQELQQENSQKQLLSPLPFPTTLPLLSACIAQQKTVVADPVRHLQSLTHDMLVTVVDRSRPPPIPGTLGNYASIFLLRDMSVALSSCIYQSLSDSDSINVKKLATTSVASGAVLEALSRLSVVYQDSSLISSTTSRRMSYDVVGVPDSVTTEPSKWPGVASLRALLDREKDEEAPNLNVLLCEAYVAIFIGLFSYAMATCDAHILFRLVGQRMTPQLWSSIFGGGSKKVLQVATNSQFPLPGSYTSGHADHMGTSQDSGEGAPGTSSDNQGILNTMTSRVKLNFKVLGVQLGAQGQDATSPSSQPEKQTFREQFTAPEMSIVSRLMMKPYIEGTDAEIDYDSGEESDAGEGGDSYEDDDDDDPFSNAPVKIENREHSNPHSYSWYLIRFACIKLAQEHLEKFLTIAGIELAELPVASPLIYACLRLTERWTDFVVERLNVFGQVPENYIPGCFANPTALGPAIQKYRSLFEVQNTPFPAQGHGLGPIKRLWHYLVRQESVQKIFVKYIFGRKTTKSTSTASQSVMNNDATSTTGGDFTAVDDHYMLQQMARVYHPVKIIHKEHDAISAFCINKVSTGLMSVATQKELQELNISLLLNPASWIEGMNDEADFDVLNLNEDPESLPTTNYLVVQTPGDPILGGSSLGPSGAPGSSAASQISSPSGQPPPFGPTGQGASNQGGKGTVVGGYLEMDSSSSGFPIPFNTKVKKHKVDGIRRMAAHSHLPLYVTGCHDGSIKMWEWSHVQPVQSVRPPGVFAKVNRVRFSQQGNKFGACDADGNVALWQSSNASQPFFTYQCHSKQTSDFVFHGSSSSLFCTAGHSTDGKNVALWDTLLPQKRALVQGFTFHENGASAIACAPRHYQLITAGKKGVVAIWDLRQQRQVYFFKAHDHPIKCMALGPEEDIVVTGCVDGDIKIWSLSSYKCIHTFTEEHARHGIFKNISQGVSQVYVDQHNRLFSCGADGSIKVRQLPDPDFLASL